ncbi:MAG: hypothetical protein WKF59_21890 [Chitinophagaceae bacterium]
MWKDVLIAQTAPANLSAQIVFLNNPSKEDIEKADIKGKAVAIQVSRHMDLTKIFLSRNGDTEAF